ncbi:MAG: site-2 protease family protein [Phycisphaerales bacterium]
MFKGSLTIVTISGVPVRVHWTFLILLAWVFGTGFVQGGTVADGLRMVGLIGAVFACVVAHEFGHILAARSFGIRTRDVTLLPIGGVASLEKLPERPWQELVVALAGPLVNVVIVLALLPGMLWPGGLDSLMNVGREWRGLGRDFVTSLAVINVWLVVFNMIPAFPMDGGRVLRAVLAMFMGRVEATRAAATIGQALAVGFALFGIFAGLPMLLVLALFVFLGAGAEAAGTEAQEMLRGVPVSAVMLREFRVLGETDTLRTAVDELLANSQADFPVTRDGTPETEVVGLLTRADLVRVLAERGPSAPVSVAMRASCAAVGPDLPAQRALEALRGGECPMIPVVLGGRLVGLVNAENISEAIMVRSALGRRGVVGARAAGVRA